MAKKSKESEYAKLENYRGMFYNEEPGQRYQDELTGAHFQYEDMCRRLKVLKSQIMKKESKGSLNYKTLLVQEQKKTKTIFKALPYNFQDSRNGNAKLYGTVNKCTMGKVVKHLNNHSIEYNRATKYIKESQNERNANKRECKKM